MKIAVITRHAIFNYGSLLQTIATQQCVENLGHECVIIDYQREDEDYRKIADVLVKKAGKWNKNFLTRAVYKAVQSPKFVMMGKHFDTLRANSGIKLTDKYTSLASLEESKPEADIYMTGSDQVWGPIGAEAYDPAYFLSFADGGKRISYAASFGKTDFTPELTTEFKKLLDNYDYISVREKSALEIISNMGIDGALQVLDPTLLLDSSYWSKMIEDEFPEDYILIYQLHSNPEMMEYAYALAEKTGKTLVTMSSTAQHLAKKGGKHIFLPTLSQWLGYIKNASFMITDSFHGTAFAINFNTQFVNVLPKGTSTRNRSVLELTGLERRVVSDYNNFDCYDDVIDFDSVNAVIEKERDKSYEILKNMIEN